MVLVVRVLGPVKRNTLELCGLAGKNPRTAECGILEYEGL